MEVKDHLPLEELKRLERVEKDANRAKRLRILILGVEGWTAPAVAMAVGLSRRICQRWVRRYNEEGLAGLDDRRGRESKLPLSPEQQQQMRARLDAGPSASAVVAGPAHHRRPWLPQACPLEHQQHRRPCRQHGRGG